MIFYSIVAVLVLFIAILFALTLVAAIVADFTADVPFVSIPDGIDTTIINSLNLTGDSVLYDMGCGDGRVLIKAVESEPSIRAIGIEIALIPYVLAKFYTRKYNQIVLRRENIFKTNIADATHIFLYLYPKVVSDLISNIKKQCKPGTRIVSCDFEIDSLVPSETINLKNTESKRGQKLFVYTI